MMKSFSSLSVFACLLALTACQEKEKALDIDANLKYCSTQAQHTLISVPAASLPRNVDQGDTTWRYVSPEDWTSGFWPGILWYLYESTGEPHWKIQAEKYTKLLLPLSQHPANNHDLGFQVFNSFGNAYRLTNNPEYKQVLIRTADSLACLYNPKVGTILSWPRMVAAMNWPHNTIIDNMMNLELLFWASKNGGSGNCFDIALHHAETTMMSHFRKDYTSFHVVVYDTVSGKMTKGITHQGFADSSMWARGQAWAIYGFTMVYRETQDKRFLDFVQKVTDVYIEHLPEDLIPYWDFNAPGIPNEPRDASAAAITASALLELSQYVDPENGARYRAIAIRSLEELSSDHYQSKDVNSAFLLHSTGNKPQGTEVDASIVYADYYYLEALLRLKKSVDQKHVAWLKRTDE